MDGELVTSRKPDDLPAFCGAMIDAFARAPSRRRRALPGASGASAALALVTASTLRHHRVPRILG